MAKFLCCIRMVLLILPLLSLSQTQDLAQAQEITSEIPKIKVDVALVTTEVTVLGAAASDLRAEDFVVYDNGVAQQTTHFSRDKVPLAVALLMDRSSSIKPYLSLLQKAAVSALGQLKAEDPVALFAFDEDLLKLSDLTRDRSRIDGIIGKLTIGNGTSIYDAISSVADYLRAKAPHHRRAIILVSDNCQTVPGRVRGDSARVDVLESAATLYSIKTPGSNYALDMRARDPVCHDSIVMVKELAEESGGQVLDVEALPSLQEALEKAISNLRLQYTLGFSPSDPGQEGSFHKLTVRLAAEHRCPACRLLVRSGYYAGSPPVPLANQIQLASPEQANKTAYWMILRKIEAAATINSDLPDIPFVARTASQKDSDGKPQIRVDLQIDFAGVGFKTVGDRRTCKLHLAVFFADERGKTFDPEFRTLEGTLQEETYNRVLKAGMSVSFAVPLKAPKQNLKIVLYDEGSDTLGSQRTHFP
jgi:Ca-activated chloride channel homolog